MTITITVLPSIPRMFTAVMWFQWCCSSVTLSLWLSCGLPYSHKVRTVIKTYSHRFSYTWTYRTQLNHMIHLVVFFLVSTRFFVCFVSCYMKSYKPSLNHHYLLFLCTLLSSSYSLSCITLLNTAGMGSVASSSARGQHPLERSNIGTFIQLRRCEWSSRISPGAH